MDLNFFHEKCSEIVHPANVSRHSVLIGSLVTHINEIIKRNNLEKIAGNRSETKLACGLATSPHDAAQCIEDTNRTMKLMMAVYHACIDALEKENRSTPLRILYAGCGPLAPAILAAAALLPPEKVKFVLMDIHEDSVKAAKIIAEGLGIGPSIEEYITADASTYRHNRGYDLNGLIVFSFNKGLFREPQLPVTANLVLQLSKPALLIPEAIDFFSYIVDPDEELQTNSLHGERKEYLFDPEKASQTRIEVGPVFRLNAGNAAEVQKLIENKKTGNVLNINLISHPIPQNRPPAQNMLMLSSVIMLYNDIVLREYESPLTFPTFFLHGQSLSEGSRVTFSYMMSDVPGFIHTVQ